MHSAKWTKPLWKATWVWFQLHHVLGRQIDKRAKIIKWLVRSGGRRLKGQAQKSFQSGDTGLGQTTQPLFVCCHFPLSSLCVYILAPRMIAKQVTLSLQTSFIWQLPWNTVTDKRGVWELKSADECKWMVWSYPRMPSQARVMFVTRYPFPVCHCYITESDRSSKDQFISLVAQIEHLSSSVLHWTLPTTPASPVLSPTYLCAR